MIVYKYVHQDRFDILQKNCIRFTQAGALNDPFDTLPSITEIKDFVLCMAIEDKRGGRSALPSTEMKILLDENRDAFKDFAKKCQTASSRYYVFLSLTKQCDNLLMWSHYANSHLGFVLGFDANSPFFAPGKGKAKDGLRKVEYTESRYQYPPNFDLLTPAKQEEASTGLLFTKSNDWAYEKELRILAHPEKATFTKTLANGERCHLFQFPPESLQKIIFGFAMPDCKRQEITDMVKKKYPNAQLFQAKLHDDKFELKISKLSQCREQERAVRRRESFE